ncbi:MAG: phospholipid carrier-dependent glycosyltransferase [Acidobacteria bacterium]|nr:phospholipid carrier-dependent glycosyltransferase [Acidobacteriota bacterium]
MGLVSDQEASQHLQNPVPVPLVWLMRISFILLIGLSFSYVVQSWTQLSSTIDEPAHIAAGMEWLDKGRFIYEPKHPPLVRVAVALGPYLKGIRSFSKQPLGLEGLYILHASEDHVNTLASARKGNLPFLALACLSIFLWTRRWFSTAAAYWAVLLFLNLPSVLAHAGVAALDMACAATVNLALYFFVLCLENPSWRNFAFLGFAVALAFLAKLSSPAFLGLCFALGLACFFRRKVPRISANPVAFTVLRLQRMPSGWLLGFMGGIPLFLWALQVRNFSAVPGVFPRHS